MDALAAALFAGSRHHGIGLHFNKGLAGAPPEAIAAAGDTATHPGVMDAFCARRSSTMARLAYAGFTGAAAPDPAKGQSEYAGCGQSQPGICASWPRAWGSLLIPKATSSSATGNTRILGLSTIPGWRANKGEL